MCLFGVKEKKESGLGDLDNVTLRLGDWEKRKSYGLETLKQCSLRVTQSPRHPVSTSPSLHVTQSPRHSVSKPPVPTSPNRPINGKYTPVISTDPRWYNFPA